MGKEEGVGRKNLRSRADDELELYICPCDWENLYSGRSVLIVV